MTAPSPERIKFIGRVPNLKKTHDAMAHFLIELCRLSDEEWKGLRTKRTEQHYKRARQFIKQAGFKYEPKKQS